MTVGSNMEGHLSTSAHGLKGGGVLGTWDYDSCSLPSVAHTQLLTSLNLTGTAVVPCLHNPFCPLN